MNSFGLRLAPVGFVVVMGWVWGLQPQAAGQFTRTPARLESRLPPGAARATVASGAKAADADSSSPEPEWRRTVNGWERAEHWLRSPERRSHAPPPIHPLLLALLELLISVAALAKWPPRYRA